MPEVDSLQKPVRSLLSVELAGRLLAECEAAGAAPEAFCAEAIRKHVASAERRRRRGSNPSPGAAPEPDQATRDRLRVLVAQAVRESRCWKSLDQALAENDLGFAPLGGGLALKRRSTGELLAKASAVGPGYALLIAKFKAGFPGHPHRWLAEKILSGDKAPNPHSRSLPANLTDGAPLVDFG